MRVCAWEVGEGLPGMELSGRIASRGNIRSKGWRQGKSLQDAEIAGSTDSHVHLSSPCLLAEPSKHLLGAHLKQISFQPSFPFSTDTPLSKAIFSV